MLRRALALPSRRRGPLVLSIVFFFVILHYQLFQRYDTRPGSARSRLHQPAAHPASSNALQEPNPNHNLTIDLVIASRREDDISWTRHLSAAIPNLQVIRYISNYLPDKPLPEFHPPLPKKGREATVYHTYLQDFYPRLPDVSIFIHAEEQPWHIEGVLQQSMLFALSHLDYGRIAERGGYTNLRVAWADNCPSGIDTTLPPEVATRKEVPFMRQAFESNFPDEAFPSMFAGPCCSQFAVTREAIRRNHRSQYARSQTWLMTNHIGNQKAGRTWEHMWPWLFLHNAPAPFNAQATKDCPAEWNTYCAMYGICFGDAETGADVYDAPSRYNDRWAEKETLRRDHLEEWWNRLFHPLRAAQAAKRIAQFEKELDEELTVALERGKNEHLRDRAFKGLFA